MTSASTADSITGPGLWQRLRHSPLRDVVRGRITGRLDLARHIADAGLPAPLYTVVRTAVKSTRLTRLERIDVADELITHFMDGLDAGVSAEALAETFGEAKTSGRLIGRAKKRNRPLLWLAAMRGVKIGGAVFGLLLLWYVVAALQFFLIKPSPAIDFRAQINEAALAVPEGERAWPHYRTALLEMPDPPDFSGLSNREPRPGEPGWADVEAYLTGQAASLEGIRQASKLDGFGFVTGYALDPADQELWPDLQFSEQDIEESGLYAVLLPHLSEMRTLAKIVRADALRAAAAGEGATALADVEALLGMARQLRENPFIITDLVSLSIYRMTLEAIGDVMHEHPEVFSDEQLQRLAHVMAGHGPDLLRIRFEGERIGFEDIAQRIYSDDGRGDGRLTARGCTLLLRLTGGHTQDMSDATIIFAGPALRSVMLSRREMLEELNRHLDELTVHAATPLWEREPSGAEAKLEEWNSSVYSRMQHFPLAVLMPALSKASLQTDLALQQRGAIMAVLALELHRRDTGAWPESLEALSPMLLPQPPLDHFDGRTLRYRVGDDGPVLYSVGADRDDDGGAHLQDASQWKPGSFVESVRSGAANTFLPDGDWVHWPRVIEPFIDYDDAATTDDS